MQWGRAERGERLEGSALKIGDHKRGQGKCLRGNQVNTSWDGTRPCCCKCFPSRGKPGQGHRQGRELHCRPHPSTLWPICKRTNMSLTLLILMVAKVVSLASSSFLTKTGSTTGNSFSVRRFLGLGPAESDSSTDGIGPE